MRELRRRGDPVVPVDGSLDVRSAEFAEVIARARPEVVIHLAALSSVADSWERPEEYYDVNVGGTERVLTALVRARPGARCLVVSSAEVYGVVSPDEVPLREDSPLRPVNPYAETKARSEEVARRFTEDLEVVILRPFTHTGPGQSERFVVPALAARLLRALRDGDSEIPVGNLEARRDFSDVRDVVRAYLAAGERGVPGATYNVASGVGRSIREIADELRDVIYPSARLVVESGLLRPVENPVLIGSAEALCRETRWRAELPWASTLRDVVDDVRRRLDVRP
jgi:GDP-4-dehydro-6-deoxy-D-mannose reductase